MGTALSLSTNLKMGPVVAALGALAAGTLVAATILGQSLGPIPVDQPAIAMQPGAGMGNPLVVEVPGAESTIDAGVTGILAANLGPLPAQFGSADDLFPSKSAADRSPVTSVVEEERVEPVPTNEDLLTQVQRRVAEIVRASAAAPVHASIVDEKLDRPERRNKTLKKARSSAAPSEGSTARTSGEPAPQDDPGVTMPAKVAAPVKQATDVVEESLGSKEEGASAEVVQEASPTAAGPASPVL